MSQKFKVERLEEIYAELPKIKCKGLCQESCGPIMMEKIEWKRIIRRLGYTPKPNEEQAKSLTCPMLTPDGKCEVYDVRPMICRLWGVAKEMLCPFGCVPERTIEKLEGFSFLSRVQKLSEER